jgi:hypothetical protein
MRSEDEGRRIVLGIAVMLVISDLTPQIIRATSQGPGASNSDLWSVGFPLFLAWFLYEGARWARWVTAIGTSLISASVLVAVLRGVAMPPLTIAGATVCAVSALLLWFSPSVRTHFVRRETLRFDGKVYWDGPFCPRCQDRDRRSTRMADRGKGYTGCARCDFSISNDLLPSSTRSQGVAATTPSASQE